MDKLDLILSKLEEMQKSFSNDIHHVKSELSVINHKLDVIKEQTATNTEYQYDINQIANKVSDLETDVKIIKKAISNQ